MKNKSTKVSQKRIGKLTQAKPNEILYADKTSPNNGHFRPWEEEIQV